MDYLNPWTTEKGALPSWTRRVYNCARSARSLVSSQADSKMTKGRFLK
jgi:hypothetical protein